MKVKHGPCDWHLLLQTAAYSGVLIRILLMTHLTEIVVAASWCLTLPYRFQNIGHLIFVAAHLWLYNVLFVFCCPSLQHRRLSPQKVIVSLKWPQLYSEQPALYLWRLSVVQESSILVRLEDLWMDRVEWWGCISSIHRSLLFTLGGRNLKTLMTLSGAFTQDWLLFRGGIRTGTYWPCQAERRRGHLVLELHKASSVSQYNH